MRLDIIRSWEEALRSGKFEQTESCLKNADGHCCLGVLSEILPPEVSEGTDWEWDTKEGLWTNSNTGDDEGENLPAPIRDRVGISAEEESTLIAMNDGDTWWDADEQMQKESQLGFAEIADHIKGKFKT